MNVTRIETTIIPQTYEGIKYADMFTKILNTEHIAYKRTEGTTCITIEVSYMMNVGVEEGNDGETI